MNPVIIGVLAAVTVAIVGIVLAVRDGVMKSATRQESLPLIDLNNPLVIELSKELRALDALPLSTKEERKDWETARWAFDKKLRTIWSGIYDSLPHELEHYLGDADIRAKDAGYAQHQRRKLAALLTPQPELLRAQDEKS